MPLNNIYLGVGWTMMALMLAKVVISIVLARRYYRQKPWLARDARDITATIIIPAYNEELSIANCIAGMAMQTHKALSIIVVDDGSTDHTYAEAQRAAAASPVPVTVMRQDNGGKAAALNHGILVAESEVIICVDADSVLEPNAVARIVEPFANPEVAAVSGNVKIANRDSMIGKQQTVEYLSGFNLQRAAFAELGAVPVASGALSAFRVSDLRAVGGYSSDTVVEDFDITVAIQRLEGRRIVYRPDAVAWTEGPLNLRDFIRQRHRWTFGLFQVLRKHRDVIFTRREGRIGSIGLPYFLICPWEPLAVSAMFVTTLIVAADQGDLPMSLTLTASTSILLSGLNMYAASLSNDPKRLALWGILPFFGYALLLAFICARAGLHYVWGANVEWTKLERAGSNRVPTPAVIKG
jgi:cellulose synthase/poly-beta-1,6-N-acetylglucosamine synthase-like glycosyltransferase